MKGPAAIVSTWAPPTLGAPQSLGNILRPLPKNSYFLITSQNHLESSKTDGERLPCEYFYFDKGGKKLSYPQNRILGSFVLLAAILKYAIVVFKKVRAKKASMIIAVSDGGPALLSAYFASLMSGLPLVLYLFDLYQGNCLDGPQHVLARLFEAKLFRRAKRVLVTNEATRDYYLNKYGGEKAIEILYNSIDLSFSKETTVADSNSVKKDIVFTGNVYWSVEQSLKNLILAMDEIRDLPLRLKIFAPRIPEELQKIIDLNPNIQFGLVPADQVKDVQAQAWLLYLPMSWNTPFPDIIRTASPAKLTDYILARRPILVHAPEEAYVSRFVKEHHLGMAVTQNDVKTLANSLRDLYDKKSLSEYDTKAGSELVNRFDALRNSSKLETILKSLH
jgi:glycosyltransferase involved in cell wall biosynthesis